MKVVLFALILWVQVNISFAQTDSLVIINAFTGEFIPFATIKVNNQILYSNKFGIFFKPKKNFKATVSHIGFLTKTFLNLSLKDTILLTPTQYQLKEVVVSSKRKKTYKLGYYNHRSIGSNTLTSFKNDKVAVFIPSDGKASVIKEILISKKRVDPSSTFKVLLFETDSLRKPGTVMFDTLIQQNGNIKNISIEELNLKIPKEGIFIGFEGTAQKNEQVESIRLNVTEKLTQNLTYLNMGYGWVSYIDFYNVRFGLKMIEE